MRVAALCGSFRAGSFNQMLLDTAIDRAPSRMAIAQVDIREFPFYSQDIEQEGFPQAVLDAKRAIQASDCVLLVSPEYDYGVPGYLKNAVDWLSRPVGDPTLVGRPMAVMGASSGFMGTIRGQLAWRQSWYYFKAPVFSGVEMTLARSATMIDEHGRVVDANALERLDAFLAGLDAWLEKVAV